MRVVYCKGVLKKRPGGEWIEEVHTYKNLNVKDKIILDHFK